MTTEALGSQSLAASQRLLDMAREQTRLLEAGEIDAFQRLTEERAAVQRIFEQPVPPSAREAVRRVLEQVAQIDRQNIELVRRQMRETEAALRQIRRGHVAIQGYARPGAHLVALPSMVDRVR